MRQRDSSGVSERGEIDASRIQRGADQHARIATDEKTAL